MLFDTHTHINVDAFDQDVDQVIQNAKDKGISRMAVVGFNDPTIERAIELKNKYEGIYLTLGWHPTQAGSYSEEVEEKLFNFYLKEDKVVAVGEMGLDFHWMEDPKEVQMDVFRREIRLAKAAGLPVSIHNREATEECYKILKEEHVEDIGGIMHSFNVDTYWMEKFLDLGMEISLSGVVTFKNAPEVREIAKAVPIGRLLLETDAPYLAPVPKRGRRNEPAYVRYVAEQVGDLRGISMEEVAHATTQNAKRLFGI